MDIDLIIVAIYSYLLGSIPFGLLLTRIFLKKDIRTVGSGNIGTTNVLRTGNKFLAITTLALDLFKGYISVYITIFYFDDLTSLSALICFIGHIFPVWLKFKGGKGVATFIGAIAILNYVLCLIFLISWAIVAKIFKISSLSAIVAFLITFVATVFLYENDLILVMSFFTVFSIFTHRENIKKIISGEESKIKTK